MNLGWRDLVKLPVTNYNPIGFQGGPPGFTRHPFIGVEDNPFLFRCSKKLKFCTVNIPPDDYLHVSKKEIHQKAVINYDT